MISLLSILQLILITAVAPLALGLVRMYKARFQGRVGASPFLPYYSLATLMKKQMVISSTTTWVFRSTPFVVLGSSVFLALVLPLILKGGVFAEYGNFVVIAGVLAIGAVFLVLGGIDVGSAFGGMGASREMTITSLVEPSIIMVLGTFALVSRSLNIDGMVASASISLNVAPYLILTFAAFVLILLAENSRYPLDNPATHLELTMVHEAMILEYSGPYLAMLEYASALKLTVFSVLLFNLFLPDFLITVGSDWLQIILVIALTFVKIVAAMFLLALIESSIAKMRFYRLQEYLSGAFLISLAGMILALIHKFI